MGNPAWTFSVTGSGTGQSPPPLPTPGCAELPQKFLNSTSIIIHPPPQPLERQRRAQRIRRERPGEETRREPQGKAWTAARITAHAGLF